MYLYLSDSNDEDKLNEQDMGRLCVIFTVVPVWDLKSWAPTNEAQIANFLVNSDILWVWPANSDFGPLRFSVNKLELTG